MSDPRFARLKSDPRFRRPKTKTNKVVIDDRFKSVFAKDKTKAGRKVDKYGRPVAKTEAQDNLRRYYRLEGEDEEAAAADEAETKSGDDAEGSHVPDLARGEVLLESSDEDDEEDDDAAGSSDGGFVALGRDVEPRAAAPASDDEIDLDESTNAALAAQAAAYTAHRAQFAEAARDADMERTARLAVVNLDWDHVRAAHLYKICASLVHPTAPRVPASATSSSSAALLAGGGKRRHKRGEEGALGGAVPVARGRVLSVRVYPSEFGKARMAREEAEGPPAEIFKKKGVERPEEVNARTVYEVGGEDEYDEDALRKYQLERLR